MSDRERIETLANLLGVLVGICDEYTYVSNLRLRFNSGNELTQVAEIVDGEYHLLSEEVEI